MRQRCLAKWIVSFAALALAGCQSGAAQAGAPYAADQPSAYNYDPSGPPPPPDQEQPEVLTRGPVHEAFAEPVNVDVQDGLIAPSEPPANIAEMPPAERPEGDNIVWVPGYWSWDADRTGYIWVSACWRAAPPSMSWVPGYWTHVAGGWEWVPGFWTPAGEQEIEYLPAPPALADVQPPGPGPSADTIWVPPCWYWQQDQYVRRPGYWLAAHPGWVWVASHNVWTPRGYVLAAGHWDYPLEGRGVLFAPVYFPRSVYARSGFTYSPSIVVDLDLMSVGLFSYPRYSHYYFGDYYDDAYVHVGIYPWFDREHIHTWYDPIYEYDRWNTRRTEPRWEEQQRHEYDARRADKDLRPARTYREMQVRVAKAPEPQRRNVQVARPLREVVTSKTTTVKFERINTDVRQKIVTQATDVHKFGDERSRWESTPVSPKTAPPPTERRGAATPPAERKEPVAPRAETREPANPSRQDNQRTPPAERKQPDVSREPTPERAASREPTRQPAASREPTREPAAPSGDRKAPGREVQATRAERVKVPASPIGSKPAASGARGKGPPPRPDNERNQNQEKDTRKDQSDRKDN